MLSTLIGCASSPDADDPYAKSGVEEIYKDAKAALDDGNYETAIKLYEKLESRFPYGRYAERAQMEIIYAYYFMSFFYYSFNIIFGTSLWVLAFRINYISKYH